MSAIIAYDKNKISIDFKSFQVNNRGGGVKAQMRRESINWL